MSIELIQKLIRLANNNPNEHEANLAARKACKMIAEGKHLEGPIFKIPETKADDPIRTAYQDVYDFMQDLKRKQTQAQQSNPWVYEPSQKQKDFYNDLRECKYYGFNYGQPLNSKKTIVCSKCKEPKITRYIGEPSIWICMECRGKEYKNATT